MSGAIDSRSAQQLYDDTVRAWVRTEPASLSDFTARPLLLEMCAPVLHSSCLDLGCGEGYCSRLLRRAGAQAVLGIDVSSAMIDAARQEEQRAPLGIGYRCGDATDLSELADGQFDRVLAVFLFNYLDCDAMRACMTEVARVLRPGGRFVFAVPHPLFPYVRAAGKPFYFDLGGQSYFSARNRRFNGRIWKRDGTQLQVQVVHKTLEDYFAAINAAGFRHMPTLRELTVTPDIATIDPEFFAPLIDTPLHLAMALTR